MKRRTSSVVVALVVLALTVAACGGGAASTAPSASASSALPVSSEPSEEPVQIALFLLASANTYSQGDARGAERAAEEFGGEVTVFDGEFDASVQYSQIQDAIASGRYDAFVIAPNAGPTLMEPAVEAIEAGIKVAAIYGPLGPEINELEPQIEGLTTTSMIPNIDVGRDSAEAVIRACEGKDPCRVVWLQAIATFLTTIEQTRGLEEGLEEHPEIEIIDRLDAGNFLEENGRTVMQDYLQRNTDFDVLVGQSDQVSAGAELAMQDADVEVPIVSVGGGSDVGYQAVREGRWLSTAGIFLPETEAYLATRDVIRAVRGESVPPWTNPVTEVDIPRNIYEDNADDYEPEW